MKRRFVSKRCEPEGDGDSSDGSTSTYEDILEGSRQSSLRYGVSWEHFRMGESEERHVEAFRKVRELLEPPPQPGYGQGATVRELLELRTCVTVAKWYLGVTLCPSHRWGEEPSPHKHRWDILHVLLLGKHMRRCERRFLSVLNNTPEHNARCANVARGEDRVDATSIRFLYICFKYVAPPGMCNVCEFHQVPIPFVPLHVQFLRDPPWDDGEPELDDAARADRIEALASCRSEREARELGDAARADRIQSALLLQSRCEQEAREAPPAPAPAPSPPPSAPALLVVFRSPRPNHWHSRGESCCPAACYRARSEYTPYSAPLAPLHASCSHLRTPYSAAYTGPIEWF